MMKRSLFADESSIYKNFSILVGLNRYLSFLIKHSTVSSHYTKNIKLDMILVSIFSTNFSLTLFDVVKKHTHDCGIFRNVHDIWQFSFIYVLLLRQTRLVKKLLSIFLNLFFHPSFFLQFFHQSFLISFILLDFSHHHHYSCIQLCSLFLIFYYLCLRSFWSVFSLLQFFL